MFFRCVCLALAMLCFSAGATRTSYRLAHPMAWMYQLPVGEMPGWAASTWLNVELNHANIWNNEFDMTDKRTGDIYTYKADFEQSSVIVEQGFALNEEWAFSIDVPYAYRNGGIMDDFIDQFHQLIRSDRFLRHTNDEFSNTFIVEKNGVSSLATDHGEGVGAIKLKLKYWFWQWVSTFPGNCDCGGAVSVQAKVPTQERDRGLSSGSADYSALLHLGAPLWDFSGVWATAALTKLGPNETFAGWPIREWQQMYELAFDFGLGEHFGMMLQGRYESPLLMKEHVSYNYTHISEKNKKIERIASGYNSLAHWRGSQAIGFRWRWGEGSRVNFLFIEDWGIGKYDSRGDTLYVNNAPDVTFLFQFHFIY